MTAQRIKLLSLTLFLGLFLFASGSKVKAQACGMICPAPLTSCTNQIICDAYEPLRQENVCVASEPCHNEWQCDVYSTRSCGDVCVENYPSWSCWQEQCYESNCRNEDIYSNYNCRPEWNWNSWSYETVCDTAYEATIYKCDRTCFDGHWDTCGGGCRTDYRCWGGGCVDGHTACVGGGCIREETRSVGGGCIASHVACLGGGICPTALEPVACPNPTPSCVADITCIAANGVADPQKVCFPGQCPNPDDFPTKPAPGCTQIGEPYPINEPGKCARNCTSADGVTNLWDYVSCSAGVNPPPEEACPVYCGYLGGVVNNGTGGSKPCAATTVCPVINNNNNNNNGGTGGNNNNNSNNQNGAFGNFAPPPVASTGKFFQVKDGSVMSLGTIINQGLPTGQKFLLDGEGGTPGIPMGNGVTDTGQGTVSNTGWYAGDANNRTGVVSDKVQYRYDVDQIKDKIISLVSPAPLLFSNNITLASDLLIDIGKNDGTFYVRTNDDLIINSNLNFGTNKVVIITEKSALINGTINFDPGGLFAVIARENIEIGTNVGGSSTAVAEPADPQLEGMFVAQKRFKTGASDKQLRIDGPVIGIEGVDLERTLNSQYPAEYFVFRPDILMTLPQHLLRRNNLWKEALP